MKTLTRIALCLLVLTALSAQTFTQEKVTTTITILVPERGEEETTVKINGKKIDGDGTQRTHKVSLEKGTEAAFKIEALIVPNNYTKIVQEGNHPQSANVSVKVDMTIEQPFAELSRPDDITVRYVPTPDDIVDKMSEMAKIGKNDVVYDLGCGDARMLIRPIQKFGAKRGVGVEYDPKVMKEEAIPNVKKHKLEDKIELRQGDMLKLKPSDVADATVVLLYIGDDLGRRVGPVLKNALPRGARIVSHRFTLGDWTPNETVRVKGQDGDQYELHLWIVGDEKKK